MNHTRDTHEHLATEWNELQTTWQDSRTVWKDAVSSQFEKRFMSPFETEIPAFLSTLDAMSDELQRAQADLH